MHTRLLVSLACSLAAHAAVLGSDALRRPPEQPAARPALRATLAAMPAERPPPAEALLKNTLPDEAEARPPAPPPPPAAPPAPRRASPASRPHEAAQRKLSRHVFYPPEAIARGLEGEVRVLVVLAADGSVTDVQVAAGSGHPLLDQAALRAAWAMGALPGLGARELILPVVFRLQ